MNEKEIDYIYINGIKYEFIYEIDTMVFVVSDDSTIEVLSKEQYLELLKETNGNN